MPVPDVSENTEYTNLARFWHVSSSDGRVLSRRPQGRRALKIAVGSRTGAYSCAAPFSVSRMTSPSRSSTVLVALAASCVSWVTTTIVLP